MTRIPRYSRFDDASTGRRAARSVVLNGFDGKTAAVRLQRRRVFIDSRLPVRIEAFYPRGASPPVIPCPLAC